jgi:hypothetical protein
LAEIVAANWGNLRVATRVVAIEDTEVVAVAQAIDLESNVAIQVEARRLIVGKYGRYSDDMIRVTGAAAAAVAFREAVFKIVPRASFQPIYDAALVAAAGGGGKSLSDRRKKAVEHFERLGVDREKLCSLLEVNSEEQIGASELQTLRGWVTSIETGETTIADLLGNADAPRPTGKRARAEAATAQALEELA